MGWAGEAEERLYDSWFEPIEEGLRAKVRGFIETMIEEELTSALSLRGTAGAERAPFSSFQDGANEPRRGGDPRNPNELVAGRDA
jgi:hypothetical protein